jgi:probable phosphoglycerate mutase
MRLLIIRHGDPDYAIDGLTEKGKKEAELLKNKLVKEDISSVYCSVYGRAKKTIEPTLNAKGITATYCDWLREFDYARIRVPYLDNEKIAWDLMPEFANEHPEIFISDKWMTADFIKNTNVYTEYVNVCNEFDKVLASHGYVRDGYNYRVTNSNKDTLVFTCHYGLTCVLLSHLMNCSPYTLWQHAFTPPSSVTTFYSEERTEGFASFRANGIGDISHLYAFDEQPAFAGRFCECFKDDTRH